MKSPHDKTQQYPLDFSKIEKGWYLSPEEIQKIVRDQDGYPVEIGSPDYAYEVMELKSVIVNSLRMTNKKIVIKHESYGLRALTDNEAADYLHRKQALHIKGFITSNTAYETMIDHELMSHEKRNSYFAEKTKLREFRRSLEREASRLSIRPYINDQPKDLPGLIDQEGKDD